MSDKKQYTNINVGSVLRAPQKDGDTSVRHYMKFERRKDKNKQYVGDTPFPLIINEGDTLNMYNASESRARAVAAGKLTQDQADSMDFIRFDIVRSVVEGEQPKASAPLSKKSKSEVDF